MWSEQGRENSINTKYFLMCLFARSLKQEDYAHYSICITVSSSQTDAITWDILASWCNWELCIRILMKKWGLCEGGYVLEKKKKKRQLGIGIVPDWVDLRLFFFMNRKVNVS